MLGDCSTATDSLPDGQDVISRRCNGKQTSSEHVQGGWDLDDGDMAVRLAGPGELDSRQVEFRPHYVLEELEKRGSSSVEGSGHLLALDKHTTGDGGVRYRCLQACVPQRSQTVAQLLSDVLLVPANVDQCSPSAWSKLAGQRPSGETGRRSNWAIPGALLIQ
jgi:hypothetical protein